MRVCHITSVHPRYDIRIFIKECQSLASVHAVSLIVADSFGYENKHGVEIHDVGKVSGGRLERIRKTGVAIFHKVRELNPEIVHFHDPELISIGLKLTRLGYKVIYDVHEDVPKQVMNKHWIPRLIRPLISKLVQYREASAARKFAGIITATEIIGNRFKQYNAATIAIHNYPILAELELVDVDWSSRSDNLCYLGSISETRGILPLVDSLAISNLNLKLDLAGPFSNVEIEHKLKAGKGFAHVHYHGILDRDGVRGLLAKVKIGMVTLLPTPSYVESLPIKMFEYMLAGIPVIASDFELWRPIVLGNNCGLLVDPENPEVIARAAAQLLADPKLAQQMGENGRQAVLKNYSWEQEQLKLLDFYAVIK